MRNVIIFVLLTVMLVGVHESCGMSRTAKGTIIGGAAGGAVGGIIGKQSDHTVIGAIIGAAVGGAAGAYIGNYMDKQAEELQADLEGAKIERIGEGIKITFDSGILFDVDKAALRPVAQTNLDKLAVILNKYPDTNILIEGHTDSTGSDELQPRSIEAAGPVRGQLTSRVSASTRRGSRPPDTAKRSRSRRTTRTPGARRTAESRSPSWRTTSSRRRRKRRPPADISIECESIRPGARIALHPAVLFRGLPPDEAIPLAFR